MKIKKFLHPFQFPKCFPLYNMSLSFWGQPQFFLVLSCEGIFPWNKMNALEHVRFLLNPATPFFFSFSFHGLGLLPNISCFVNRLTKQWTYIGASMNTELEMDRVTFFRASSEFESVEIEPEPSGQANFVSLFVLNQTLLRS